MAHRSDQVRVTYDSEAKALYIYYREGEKVSHTEELKAGTIFADVGEDDELVGLEFLDVELEDISAALPVVT